MQTKPKHLNNQTPKYNNPNHIQHKNIKPNVKVKNKQIKRQSNHNTLKNNTQQLVI